MQMGWVTMWVICPKCQAGNHRVTDKRGQRRRRECRVCGYRWTTMEVTVTEYKTLKTKAVKMKKAKTHARLLVDALREPTGPHAKI